MMLLIDSVCLYKPSHVAPKDSLSRKSRFELKLPSNEGLLSPRPFTNAPIMFPDFYFSSETWNQKLLHFATDFS